MKIVLFILILILSFEGCQSRKKKSHNKTLVIPTSESKLIKIYAYDNLGKVKTVITGKRNVVFRNSKEIWVDQIRVLHITKEKGKNIYVQLTADKGKVNYKTLDCEAWSNAVVIREKEVRVETERIFWNHGEKKIYSKDEEKVVIFKMTNPDDPNDNSMVKTIGKNLIADNTLKKIELDKAVSATAKPTGESIF